MIRKAKTENGIVKGLPAADPRITSFKGIPFAAPPVGENRWRAPQPCPDWDGELEAYQFAPISVQNTPGLGTDVYCKEWHVDPEIPMGEDCLYLNVWTNAKTVDDKLPVLVWFFGGGFQWGYTAEMEFDGERFARRDIVVVTVNYRLNLFGFLAHPDLAKEQPDAPTNFGLLDQQAGLRWVKRNIKAFGGDPDNITIAGQSAGGGSVMQQITSPTNKDMFRKAIILSGVISSPYTGPAPGITPGPAEEAQALGKAFFDFIGAGSLAEARKLDATWLLSKYDEYVATHMRMFPSQDGVFCVGDPIKLFAEGRHLDIPVIAGNTADEFLSFLPAKDEAELKELATRTFGKDAETFLAFPESQKRFGDTAYAPVSGIECSVKSMFLESQEKGTSKDCYYYRFDADIPGPDHPGTFHSVDLWFFFETLAKCWRPFTGKHYDVARQMCNYMANFIKTGNPNGTDIDGTLLPEWKQYTKEHTAGVVFGKETAYSEEQSNTPLVDFLISKMRDRLR
ncbi:MAG: carboxylesterase family protein [Lachnospiraceae bacterium]|nr:carboxylesterase family protein [Lachnospiraceae bacterium]